jgi:hypothetical protein
MRHRNLVLPLAMLTLFFTGSASAGIVGTLKNHHRSAGTQVSQNSSVSMTGVSHKSANGVIKTNKAPGSSSSTHMVLAALSTSVGHGHKHKSSNGGLISGPASFVASDPLAPTPEPASASLVLLGLFGTGLVIKRRFQSQRS